VLSITFVLSILGQWVLHAFYGGFLPERHFSLDIWQLMTSMLIAAILAGITLRYLYLQQQLRNQQQVELQARIQALQSRIRPHFLFNSMNSIASLIASAPETAERVVEDLSELFRASLAEPAMIPIARELTLCRHYLDIEKLRLGERLDIDWQVEALHQRIEIPSLLLQPLLENAVFHGIEPLPKGGRITIQVSLKAQQVAIKISNPVPFAMQHQKNTSGSRNNRMARDNIRHRLLAHYGNRARFSTVIDNDTFTTIITYPIAPTQKG
jgi:two-component system sensor histidine kinase AlgZ